MKRLAIAVLAMGLCLAVAGRGAALTGARQGCILVFNTTPTDIGILVRRSTDDSGQPWGIRRGGFVWLEIYGKPILVSEQTLVWYKSSLGNSQQISLKDHNNARFDVHATGGPIGCTKAWEVHFSGTL